MKLLTSFDGLLQKWCPVFSQQCAFERARRLTFGLLPGGHTRVHADVATSTPRYQRVAAQTQDGEHGVVVRRQSDGCYGASRIRQS